MVIEWGKHDEVFSSISGNKVMLGDKFETENCYFEVCDDNNYSAQYDIYSKVNDDYLGLITFELKDNQMYVETFEVDEESRRLGYGSMIIRDLVEAFNLDTLTGVAICNGSSVAFWNSFGANIPTAYATDDTGWMIPFTLNCKQLV